MMPYKRRYTIMMRLHKYTHIIIQTALFLLMLSAAYYVNYHPNQDVNAALNAAVDSCQARGYFDVGTVRVQCQVGE